MKINHNKIEMNYVDLKLITVTIIKLRKKKIWKMEKLEEKKM